MADIFDFYVYDDRSIQFTLAEPIMLEDKDVTQFLFRIPKVLNGIDMTSWEWWFIFVNAKKVKYTTQLTLEDDEDDPDNFSVATYTVGYGFSGYVGSVSFSIEALNVIGEDIVNEWHTRTYNTTVTDTLQGSRAVIPEPGGQSGTGLTEEIRQALLQIARKVAYIDEHGQTYYNNLYDALYAIQAVTVSPTRVGLTTIGATSQLIGATVPSGGTITWTSSDTSVATVSNTGLVTSVGYGTATITATSGGKSGTCSVLVAEATLTEISAVYTPSGTVYESDSLDSLKSRLVVTAHWSNGTTSEVASADYTLSGTLTAGESTITVSYGGMTTTFEVTVVGLTGITATYTQSGTVYDTASLDDLKSDLVVTANYSDGTSETVTDYTLSGTLAEGTSTITVTYAGLTDTFDVNVSEFLIYQLLNHSFDGQASSIINTNVAPIETDSDFTWSFDLTWGSQVVSNWCLANCLKPSGSYPGIAIHHASGQMRINWMTSYASAGSAPTNGDGVKIVLTHESGSGTMDYHVKVNSGTVATGTITAAFQTISAYLYVGGNDSGNRTWTGTVNSFEIYPRTWSQTEIDSFMAS